MSNPKTRVTRRRFLAASGAAALAGAAGDASAATGPGRDALPRRWDATVDVLVVGSGFAGLSAAIEARNAGATVRILEKMPLHGGNSIVNGGDFGAAGTPMQAAAGVQDSPEQMLKDMLRAGGNLNHVALARMVAERSAEALRWAQEYVGARFVKLNFHGGHSVKRAHQCEGGSGAELVNKLLAKALALGVVLEKQAKLERFVTGADGRVLGAQVRRGYLFPDEASGRLAAIRARRAIVLASGGFSQDIRLRQVQDPRLTERFESTNHPGATGEALLAACRAGAMDLQMDWIQLGPWTSPDEPGFGQVPQFCERLVGYGPMVDPATGKRFFKETGNRKERADAIIALGHPVIILADAANVAKNVLPKTLEKGLAQGAIRRFDSLEELAGAFAMPVAAFVAEVARFNDHVAQQRDPDFDCKIFPDARPNTAPPFYAARLWPRVHHTMGGLAIDERAQVQSFDLRPVAGLYAAGEVTGGVHGAVRLGSVAMADCIVFGRIAGVNAAREEPWC